LVIGWYEPNPTTVEGINTQLVMLSTQVETNKNDITNLSKNVNSIADSLNLYVKQVAYQEKMAAIDADISELKRRTTWSKL
jgi:chromosome condensin MukBEF ATPase and DNA-binding subunit MukB